MPVSPSILAASVSHLPSATRVLKNVAVLKSSSSKQETCQRSQQHLENMLLIWSQVTKWKPEISDKETSQGCACSQEAGILTCSWDLYPCNVLPA